MINPSHKDLKQKKLFASCRKGLEYFYGRNLARSAVLHYMFLTNVAPFLRRKRDSSIIQFIFGEEDFCKKILLNKNLTSYAKSMGSTCPLKCRGRNVAP